MLKRVFNIGMQHRPYCCGGELEIIVGILERPVIHKFMNTSGWTRRRRSRRRRDLHGIRMLPELEAAGGFGQSTGAG